MAAAAAGVTRHSSIGYVPSLDGIRAVAISLVLVHHAMPLWSAGLVGVDVFFVLSGYLITTILLRQLDRTGGIRLRRFYGRRLFRLYPALLALIIVFVIASPWLARVVPNQWLGLAGAASYTTNLIALATTSLGEFRHTWTLSQEEQFYLVWPLVLIGASRLRVPRKVLVALLVLLTLLSFAAFYRLSSDFDGSWNPLARVGGMAAGCALAIALHHGWLVRARTAWASLGAVIILGAVLLNTLGLFTTRLLMPVSVVGAVLIITGLMAGQSRIRTVLELRPLVYVGLISYSLYLWHYPILFLGQQVLGWGLLLTAVVGIPASFIIAAASRRWIEAPGLALFQRISVTSRSASARPTPTVSR